MQFDRDTRGKFRLEHKNIEIFQGPTFCQKFPSNFKININLIEPCNKKEFADVIREIEFKTIEQFSKKDFVDAYFLFLALRIKSSPRDTLECF